ncbi:hypothetical protein ABID22_003397 [Pontibacter aydingkolensis]|nr:hypothetical protein [Pontibacter aydingkolensis]
MLHIGSRSKADSTGVVARGGAVGSDHATGKARSSAESCSADVP